VVEKTEPWTWNTTKCDDYVDLEESLCLWDGKYDYDCTLFIR